MPGELNQAAGLPPTARPLSLRRKALGSLALAVLLSGCLRLWGEIDEVAESPPAPSPSAEAPANGDTSSGTATSTQAEEDPTSTDIATSSATSTTSATTSASESSTSSSTSSATTTSTGTSASPTPSPTASPTPSPTASPSPSGPQADTLSFSGSYSARAADCHSAFTVSVLDQNGDPYTPTSDLVVALTSGGPGRFYRDANCVSTAATITLNGSSRTALHYQSLGIGSAEISASANGISGADETLTLASSLRVASGRNSGCATLADGTLKCWGLGTNGRLGYEDTRTRGDGAGEMGSSLPAVNLGTNRLAAASAHGYLHSCAVLDDGTAKCWGSGTTGRLGYGDTITRGDGAGEMGDSLPAIDLGGNASQIQGGQTHTCAVLEGGSLKCWGNGGNGRLGTGDTITRGDGAGEMGNSLPVVNLGTGRLAVSVGPGAAHTCVRLDSHAIECFGLGTSGRLGYGDTISRGDSASEMGDGLPAVNLGTGRTALALSVGDTHSCALLDTGAVKCWGLNSSGQLGYGDSANRGDGAGEMGDSLPAIDLGTNRTALAVAAGVSHSCALLDTGAVKCWGLGTSGRLGSGDTISRGDGAGEMGDSLPTVNLGTGRTGSSELRSSLTARDHVCLRLDDLSVKCWGLNTSGELGLGDASNRGDAAGEMGDSLPALVLE